MFSFYLFFFFLALLKSIHVNVPNKLHMILVGKKITSLLFPFLVNAYVNVTRITKNVIRSFFVPKGNSNAHTFYRLLFSFFFRVFFSSFLFGASSSIVLRILSNSKRKKSLDLYAMDFDHRSICGTNKINKKNRKIVNQKRNLKNKICICFVSI